MGIQSKYNPLANNFEAQEADLQTNDYRNALAQTMSAEEQARVQQRQFLNALTQQAAGNGPSLAQSQLQNATEQAAQQAAGAIASARGLNPAQQARLILDQQAAINQQSAGQAADLRLQEQMAARQMQGQALANMRGQDQNMVATAGGLQNQQNSTAVQNRAEANRINAGVAAGNQETTNMFVGAGLDAAGKALGVSAGGGAKAYTGGVVGPRGVTPPSFADAIRMAGGGEVPFRSPVKFAEDPREVTDEEFAMMTEGFKELPPSRHGPEVQRKGHRPPPRARRFADGGAVPGPGAPVPGDHPANDTVPAMLSPGEIVLPRSVAMDEDAPDEAADFVAAIKRGQEPEKGQPMTFGELLAKQRELDAEAARLDALLGKAAK